MHHPTQSLQLSLHATCVSPEQPQLSLETTAEAQQWFSAPSTSVSFVMHASAFPALYIFPPAFSLSTAASSTTAMTVHIPYGSLAPISLSSLTPLVTLASSVAPRAAVVRFVAALIPWNTAPPASRAGTTLALLHVDAAALIARGRLARDCGNFAVYSSDTNTRVPHWMEPGSCGADTRVWVSVARGASVLGPSLALHMEFGGDSSVPDSAWVPGPVGNAVTVPGAWDVSDISSTALVLDGTQLQLNVRGDGVTGCTLGKQVNKYPVTFVFLFGGGGGGGKRRCAVRLHLWTALFFPE